MICKYVTNPPSRITKIAGVILPLKVFIGYNTEPPLKYEIIYQIDAFEYLFVFFQLDMFRAYTPIFRSNGCYNFFKYAAYGVLGVVRCRS
jgi:hypothetical protein